MEIDEDFFVIKLKVVNLFNVKEINEDINLFVIKTNL